MVQIEFYNQVMDIMDFFLKFQGYVKDTKKFPEWMEEIKDGVEDIDMFQKNQLEALKTILEMSL